LSSWRGFGVHRFKGIFISVILMPMGDHVSAQPVRASSAAGIMIIPIRNIANTPSAWSTLRMDRFQAAKLFIRVVDLGSFSKAAADIGIGQPAATKRVAQLEKQLGSRLLHRSTHGVSPTEIGTLYYKKCKLIVHHVEEAETVATLMQSQVQGGLRISTTMDFGRRILAPLVLRFLQLNPKLQVELLFDDHLVNMVEQGIDVAIRMGRLADSTLGARYLGLNPWSVVASPDYVARHGQPMVPGDLAKHDALIVSTIQHDARWHFSGAKGEALTVQVKGPLRSNNKSALLTAARAGFGIAALPTYVVHESIKSGALVTVLNAWTLPPQEIHAVYPSPRMVPAKVSGFIEWLQGQMGATWWTTHFSVSGLAVPNLHCTSSAVEEVCI
jgi:DNA-binding transcriptional LysR family regulator